MVVTVQVPAVKQEVEELPIPPVPPGSFTAVAVFLVSKCISFLFHLVVHGLIDQSNIIV